ncbi:uncharacterized protein LOC143148111 [Ptiloglossa arizonensis]|uniref:uncharacterized protein LOC143148111 n=1 Tax=Ptiloglossa arizonensis TaxID=3350558 RepID=UPI003F9FD2F6
MRNLMEKQLSWLALLMTAFYSLLGSCRSQECGHERVVECGRPLEKVYNSELSLTTKKEVLLQQICPHMEAGIKCIQTYTVECLQEKQRGQFYSLYASTNEVIMELCHDGPYQDEFLKYAPCMQKVQPMYELCSKRYQRITEEIQKPDSTTYLGGSFKSLCCGFKEYLECSHHAVRRQCGDGAAQFTKKFLDRMSQSLSKVHCEYYTEEVCAIGSDASIFRVQTIVPVLLVLLARYST